MPTIQLDPKTKAWVQLITLSVGEAAAITVPRQHSRKPANKTPRPSCSNI